MKPQIKIFCFFIVCLNLTRALYSQNYPIIFDEMDGLPSNHVYDCVQDDEGKMWITTDKGISSYDGYQFTNYGLESKLTTLFNWELTKDSKGRIWLSNRQTPFVYIYKGEFHTIYSSFKDIYCSGICEDDLGNIYYSSINNNKTHLIDTAGLVTEIDSALLGINSIGEKIWLQHQVSYPEKYIIAKQKFIDDYVVALCEDQEEREFKLLINNTMSHTNYEFHLSSIANELIHFEAYAKGVISLSTDKGLFLLDLESKKVSPFLNDFSNVFENPALIYKDINNNFWIPDLKIGLVFMKNLPEGVKYRSYNKNQLLIEVNQAISNEIQLFFEGGSNLLIKEDSLIVINSNKHYLTSRKQKHLITHHGNELTISLRAHSSVSNFVKKRITVGQNVSCGQNIQSKLIIGAYKCHEWDENTLYIGTNTGVYALYFNDNKFHSKQLETGYVYSVKASKKWIYLGTKNSLLRINKTSKLVEVLDSSYTITNIELLNNKILARRINGELLMFPDKYDIKRIKYNNKLLFLDWIKTIDNQLWGVSSTSIFQMNQESLLLENEIKNIGLTNPHKLRLNQIKDKMFLICNEGYYSFFKNIGYQKREVEYFRLKQIKVNNKTINSSSNIFLNDNENYVQILLDAHSYPFSKELIYSYQYDNSIIYSSSLPRIELLNIPYGEYQLNITAKYKNGSQYGSTIVVSINNPLPFYYSVWFVGFINGVLIFIILIYFKRKHKKRIQLNKLKFNLIQNRQKMLTMQMKPHFLSNIFNNLQGSILNDETKKSISLIKNVDSFLRNTLLLSNIDIITISKEIENVRRYIKIENGRINKEIVLQLPSNWSSISEQIYVPVFILQPIIENSIWHGIYKGDEKTGIISISIEETSLYYIVSISDNGVGIQFTPETFRKGNSIALKNIEERLSLIDENRKTKYTFITPLNKGTNVKLYVTKNIKSHSH